MKRVTKVCVMLEFSAVVYEAQGTLYRIENDYLWRVFCLLCCLLFLLGCLQLLNFCLAGVFFVSKIKS